MAQTHIRVDSSIHSNIKEIAEKEGRTVYEVTEDLLNFSLKHYYSEEVMRYTDIERIVNDRVSKTEEQLNKSVERLAALLARVGIDNSMGLMGNITLLEKLFKIDRKKVQDELRKQGALYFSTATKEDRDKKKESKS